MTLDKAIEVARSQERTRPDLLTARVRIAERIEELERKIAEANDELLARRQNLKRINIDLNR